MLAAKLRADPAHAKEASTIEADFRNSYAKADSSGQVGSGQNRTTTARSQADRNKAA
jgi:hypothetical protein